jgi:hypothetical protein
MDSLPMMVRPLLPLASAQIERTLADMSDDEVSRVIEKARDFCAIGVREFSTMLGDTAVVDIETDRTKGDRPRDVLRANGKRENNASASLAFP